MVVKNNLLIRNALKECQMPQWKLAELLGCSEMSITRMFRKEIDHDRQMEIVELIKKGG